MVVWGYPGEISVSHLHYAVAENSHLRGVLDIILTWLKPQNKWLEELPKPCEATNAGTQPIFGIGDSSKITLPISSKLVLSISQIKLKHASSQVSWHKSSNMVAVRSLFLTFCWYPVIFFTSNKKKKHISWERSLSFLATHFHWKKWKQLCGSQVQEVDFKKQ